MRFIGLLATILALMVSNTCAICLNSTWVTCSDNVLSEFLQRKAAFEASTQDSGNITKFYCNYTLTYYQEFADCTTTFDCWNFPSAKTLRTSKYNISECTPDTIGTILGDGVGAQCPKITCDQLLPGSIEPTFAPTTRSDSPPSIMTSGTLAAMGLLIASLTF